MPYGTIFTKYDEECSLNQGIRGWGHDIVLEESENESSEMDVWVTIHI